VSNLLNVGMAGRFSSGKSFLISGLQAALEYHRVPVGNGALADKYAGGSIRDNEADCAVTGCVRPSLITEDRGLGESTADRSERRDHYCACRDQDTEN
jgi:hypothetical protein